MGDVLADHMDNQQGHSLIAATSSEACLEEQWLDLLDRMKHAHQTSAEPGEALPSWLADDSLPARLLEECVIDAAATRLPTVCATSQTASQ